MCNPADQAGVDYASDPKRSNVLVSEMDSASASIGTSKAIDNHSNGSLVEINEAVVHLSSDSLIETDGVGDCHSFDTSELFAKEVLISGKDGQEVVEGVEQTRESSKICIAMTKIFSEADGIVKDEIQIPNMHFKDPPETSGHICSSNLVKFEDDVHAVSAEYRRVETKHMENETLLENISSETKSSQIEEVKFEEEALQETSKGIAGELVTLPGLSDGANGRKVVEALDSTSVSGGNDAAAEKLLIDPCKGAEKPETQTNMGHADDRIEVDVPLLLEGLAGGSEGHSTGPCTETNGVIVVNNLDLSLDAKEQFMIDIDESHPWIEMRTGSSQGVAEQIAASSKERSSGVLQITMNCEEMENEIAVGPLETQNTPQQFEQMIKDIVVISEHVEISRPMMAMSSKEDAPRSFKEANKETTSEVEQEGAIVSSAQVQVTDSAVLKGNSRPELAEFFKGDASEHVPRSFKEANEETSSEKEQEGAIVSSVQVQVTDIAILKGNSGPELAEFSKEDAAEHVPRSFKEAKETTSEIEQEGTTVSSVQVQVTDAVLKGNSRPELAEFFSTARGSKLEKEIEEQEYVPVLAKLPLKKKLFMESPRSLRMLLFSEETPLPTKQDEKHKKDGKVMEYSSKVVPAEESHGNDNHTEHNYPAKWYADADNGETSSAFSGPIAFSGALTYQGLISYSGQVPYSGSISHRSDSSTSTRSFAFPILASDWNSSPVKMGDPDPRYYRQRRKWHFCFCCSRPSTLFD